MVWFKGEVREVVIAEKMTCGISIDSAGFLGLNGKLFYSVIYIFSFCLAGLLPGEFITAANATWRGRPRRRGVGTSACLC